MFFDPGASPELIRAEEARMGLSRAGVPNYISAPLGAGYQPAMLQRMQNMRQTFAQPFLSGGQFQRLQSLEADAQRNPQGLGRFHTTAAYQPPADLEARAQELQSQMQNFPGRRELTEYANTFRDRQPTAEEQSKLQGMNEALQNNPQLRQLQSQFDQLQQFGRQQQQQMQQFNPQGLGVPNASPEQTKMLGMLSDYGTPRMQQLAQQRQQSPGVNVNSGAPYGPYEQFQDQMFQQQQQARFNPYQQFQQQQQFNPYQQFQQQQQFNPYQQQQGMGIMGLLGGMPQAYGYNPMQGNFMGGFGYGGQQGGFGGGFGGQQMFGGGFNPYGGGFGGQQMFGGGFGGMQQGGFGQPQPTAQAGPFGGGFGGGFGSRGYNNAFNSGGGGFF